MGNKIVIFSILILCYCISVYGESGEALNNTESTISVNDADLDIEVYRAKLRNQSKEFEKGVKTFMKNTVKKLLPSLMDSTNDSPMTSKCRSSFMKYISGLTSVKVWAMRMLDATSKPPSGVLEGTMNDFGGFDQCLRVEVPDRKGNIEFRGQWCSIEARPFLPPPPKNFSLAKQAYAKPTDTLADELYISGMAFYYLKFRFGACIPSTCTLEDMQSVAKLVTSKINFNVQIPKCYVKEEVVFQPIHIAVIFILSLFLITCIAGSVIEYKSMDYAADGKNFSTGQRILVCFSFISNFRRLLSASKGSEELKVLHGLKALSMAYVILGHTYVWINFQLLRSPSQTSRWFTQLDFGSILNGWMAVEPFFILRRQQPLDLLTAADSALKFPNQRKMNGNPFTGRSPGLLTSYAVMQIMSKTKGRLNVPLYIIRRYLRLTPGLLLAIGLLYFLPLISSGPMWYERVDPEIRSCNKYWWRSILYISNWFGINNICVHPTWYLSADFQLHVIAAIFLIILYRCPKLGLSLITSFVLACTVMVGALTIHWELPPLILISSGIDEQILQTIDDVHFNTFTHAGPYFVGIVVGYLIYKKKDLKMSRTVVACGWMLSIVFSLASLYGAHRWNIGEGHGPILTALYAGFHRTTYSIGVAWVAFACITGHGAHSWNIGEGHGPILTAVYAGLHRTTYSIGVAWVAFACITGHGGLVNKFLSSPILAPISRLTYMIYLLHSLVIWTRVGSRRERFFESHYNSLYEYVGNVVTSVVITIPFYLLLEAPLSNLERLAFSRAKDVKDSSKTSSHLQTNLTHFAGKAASNQEANNTIIPVELMSIKHVENCCNNLGFHGDMNNYKIH